jgi:hypothetical protein
LSHTVHSTSLVGSLVASLSLGTGGYAFGWIWGQIDQSPWWMPLALAIAGGAVPMAGHVSRWYRAWTDRQKRWLKAELSKERLAHEKTKRELVRLRSAHNDRMS